MVSETNVVVVAIVIMVIIGFIFAPPLIQSGVDALRDAFSEFRNLFFEDWGGDNQTQLAWFIGLPDGTEEDINPNTFAILYNGKEITYMGFRTQIKLTYNGQINSIAYKADLSLGIDDYYAEASTISLTTTDVGASGEWFNLYGAVLSMSKDTIQGWTGATVGTHQLVGHVSLSLSINMDNEVQSLSGTATGEATIEIVQNTITLEITMKPVAISAFPTTLR